MALAQDDIKIVEASHILENGDFLFNGYGVSIWNNEKVWELDVGDGCIIMEGIYCHWTIYWETFKILNFITYML